MRKQQARKKLTFIVDVSWTLSQHFTRAFALATRRNVEHGKLMSSSALQDCPQIVLQSLGGIDERKCLQQVLFGAPEHLAWLLGANAVSVLRRTGAELQIILCLDSDRGGRGPSLFRRFIGTYWGFSCKVIVFHLHEGKSHVYRYLICETVVEDSPVQM